MTTPTPEDLHAWVEHVAVRLGVPREAIDVDALLDLTRDVAHQVARPAGPLTTFLLGYALAAADGDATRLRTIAQDLSTAAASWADARTDGTGTGAATGAATAGGTGEEP
ncbi:DUF6457 domain-containing protein [Puerhibacterium sp. TATVAM-FAB25]|uniref:DUF6457 domain-containing protein n=1 Tax=Puerhibacterium sp. TATVAM-FAB25 TaxID=3093699 RepID=UPI00397B13F7